MVPVLECFMISFPSFCFLGIIHETICCLDHRVAFTQFVVFSVSMTVVEELTEVVNFLFTVFRQTTPDLRGLRFLPFERFCLHQTN